MEFICGLFCIIGAVIFSAVFTTEVAYLIFGWLTRKERKRENKRMERKRK